MSLIFALLLSCDDTAQAGAAYQEARQALQESRYEAAIRKLQDAVRLEPRENDRLLYRDREGRQKVEYHPHYLWAEVRTREARDEKDLQVRMRLLREALTHLELSTHPSAAALLASARKELSSAEKAAAASPAPDAVLAAERSDILALADQERFEDALDRLLQDKERWDRFPAERDQTRSMIESRRRAVAARYERALELALETAAAASPLEKPDLIPSLLEPALLPPAVQKTPTGRFLWAQEFLTEYRREQPLFARSEPAEPERALQATRAFEEAAIRAALAGDRAGFRMAAHLADLLRGQRLTNLWDAGEEAVLETFLKESTQVLQRREAALSKGLQGPIEDLLGSPRDLLQKSERRIRERRALRRESQDWLGRAERSLADRSTMADPVALRKIGAEESALESSLRWGELPRDLQAQVLFLRALLDLTADVLGGERPGAPDAAEATQRIRKSKLLDPDVERAWVERLSPKLRARLPDP